MVTLHLDCYTIDWFVDRKSIFYVLVVEGANKGESQKHLSRGNQLLNAGQLAEALTHYHAAIGKI